MILLTGFLDVLFRALAFVGLALSTGGIAFYYVALRPARAPDESVRRAASLIYAGALTVAVSQVLVLLTAVAAVSDESGWPIAEFLHIGFARAGLLHSAAALVLAGVVLPLRRRPQHSLWPAAAVTAAAMLVISAWLTHGSSRLVNANPLMAVTVIHLMAAVVWIGGLMHLIAQWRLFGRLGSAERAWPRIAARFSPAALTAVVVLVGAGLYLAREFIGDASGLVGTAYGAMVLTKVSLMMALLLIGGINNITIRRWQQTGEKRDLLRRVPVFAEVEAAIGVIILMTSAALTSQPPSIDVTDRATVAEVAYVFAPKKPRLTPPPHGEMLRDATSAADLYALPGRISRIQSDFNHNISGILVILIGLGAFLNRVTRWRWTRHWPLLFLPLALFLLIIGEPNGWPLGPEPFWSSLAVPQVLSHRLATVLVAALGLIIWRVETGPWARSRWRFALPILSFIGGALLLTHSHSVFALKQAYLIEASHNALAVFAALGGAAAWLELRLSGREGRIASVIWPVFFVLVGLVLLFYREA